MRQSQRTSCSASLWNYYLSSYCCLLPCHLEKEGSLLLPKASFDVLITISSRTGWHWLIIHPFAYFSSTFPAPWIHLIIPSLLSFKKKRKKGSLRMQHTFSSFHPVPLQLCEGSPCFRSPFTHCSIHASPSSFCSLPHSSVARLPGSPGSSHAALWVHSVNIQLPVKSPSQVS